MPQGKWGAGDGVEANSHGNFKPLLKKLRAIDKGVIPKGMIRAEAEELIVKVSAVIPREIWRKK